MASHNRAQNKTKKGWTILVGVVVLSLLLAVCGGPAKPKTYTIGVVNLAPTLEDTITGFKQGMTERMFGIGDITIRGADASNPDIKLRNVSKPEEVYETLRRAWLEARKRHGMKFTEFM